MCDLNVFFWFRLAVVQPDDIDMDEDADENEARRVTCRLIMRMENRMFDNRFPALKVYKALKQLDIKRATGEPLPKIFYGSSMAHGCMFCTACCANTGAKGQRTTCSHMSSRCRSGVFPPNPFLNAECFLSNSKEFELIVPYSYLWRTYKIPIRQPYKKMRPAFEKIL